MSNKKATEYQAMLEEYLDLRDQLVAPEGAEFTELDDDVYERLEELKARITDYNRKYVYSVHYVIPDREFTKH